MIPDGVLTTMLAAGVPLATYMPSGRQLLLTVLPMTAHPILAQVS